MNVCPLHATSHNKPRQLNNKRQQNEIGLSGKIWGYGRAETYIHKLFSLKDIGLSQASSREQINAKTRARISELRAR